MCSRGSPLPVFIDGGEPTLLLDDLFGWTLADHLRSITGYRPLHVQTGPYGIMCGDPDSYLSIAISSMWGLGVLLLSLAAGMIFSARKKTAFAILGAGAAISLLDTGIRVTDRLGRLAAVYREMMIGALPGQLVANLLIQIMLPFAAALLIARLADPMRGTRTGMP